MKAIFRRVAVQTALIATLFSCGLSLRPARGEDALTIGSDAPALDVEHWVQNGQGKFKSVTEFQQGKVYVVEFWATWCGPCISSMPHIVETQNKYASKGVQIVSISDEPLETVEEFLERELPPGLAGDSDTIKTFRELTKSYCLTTDPDGSSGKDYMEAASQRGIPCAFIVGKDGKIEWIGHPIEMDEPLDQVVSDKWDREKFATEYKEAKEEEALEQEAQVEVIGLARKRKFTEAIEKLDEFIEKAQRSSMKLRLTMFKINLHQAANSDPNDVKATFQSAFALAGENPAMANQVAWTVWEMSDAGRIDSKEILRGARDLAKVGAEGQTGNSRAMILDTLSHLEYALGNSAEALKIQEEAMSVADEQGKAQLEEFLNQLKDEVGKSKK